LNPTKWPEEAESSMKSSDPEIRPSGHTPEGGVLIGHATASRSLVIFEDPQCPYCREFEGLNGPVVAAAVVAGELAVEYRMRCFLGPESVRADNALVLAAEADRFDEFRQTLFAAQPPEGTGGFTNEILVDLGAQVGLTASDFVSGVQEARYAQWVLKREELYETQDPQGTPAAWLNGNLVDSTALFDRLAFENELRA
jgi:Thioredoxin